RKATRAVFERLSIEAVPGNYVEAFLQDCLRIARDFRLVWKSISVNKLVNSSETLRKCTLFRKIDNKNLDK
ncbi:MAG TPA: hypothetical protein VJ993_08670, partial [Woeseiaceae bacterium]|nr:hypothetical protein [Woeseiaceae bacterium]